MLFGKTLILFGLLGYVIYDLVKNKKSKGWIKIIFQGLAVIALLVICQYHFFNIKVTGRQIFLLKNGKQIKFNTIHNPQLRSYHIDDLRFLYENNPLSRLEAVQLIKIGINEYYMECF